jgi:hypothetical protein
MVYRGMSSTCAPDCGTRATPRIDKVCVDTSNGIQPRTTAPSLGGTLGRLPADCAADVQTVAENWLAADAMFHKDPQWRGGDGAQSVPLGNGTVMWTFVRPQQHRPADRHRPVRAGHDLQGLLGRDRRHPWGLLPGAGARSLAVGQRRVDGRHPPRPVLR